MDETCPCTCHRAGPCTLCGCRPAPVKDRLLADLRAALARSEERRRRIEHRMWEFWGALRAMREWHRVYHGADPCRLCLAADAALSQASPDPVAAPGDEALGEARDLIWSGRADNSIADNDMARAWLRDLRSRVIAPAAPTQATKEET